MDYIIQNDYQPFQNDLQKLPHTKKTYQANDEILLTNRSYFVVTGRVVEILLLEDGNEHALVAYGPQTMFPPLFSASIAAKDELRYDVINPRHCGFMTMIASSTTRKLTQHSASNCIKVPSSIWIIISTISVNC